MLTHEEWKKQLQEVDKRYVEHNKPNKPVFSDKLNSAYNTIEELSNAVRDAPICDICGDYHESNNIPLSCESGDGK